MKYVKGQILTDEGFKKGYIGFEKSKIIEIGKGLAPKKAVANGIITPSFINFHTHIGDSFIKKYKTKLPKDIKKLVAPPNGIKHKLLKKTDEKEIINGMEESINTMLKTGTKKFIDFREGGIYGTTLLKTASKLWPINSIILSRPDTQEYKKNEIDILLKNSDGIGLSSITDWDENEIIKISRHTIKNKKIFSIHASERIRENIDTIIDLKPSFLIHMNKSTESDLVTIKENNIPIVLCPRSNRFFGLKPKIKQMKKIGVDILIGTDNAMINSPNILEEILYLKKIDPSLSKFELLKLITYNPRKALNDNCNILGSNSPADFIVLDNKTLKPIYKTYRI